MRSAVVSHQADFAGWRMQARALLATETPPYAVLWSVAESQADLFTPDEPPVELASSGPTVPRAFVGLAGDAIQDRAPGAARGAPGSDD